MSRCHSLLCMSSQTTQIALAHPPFHHSTPKTPNIPLRTNATLWVRTSEHFGLKCHTLIIRWHAKCAWCGDSCSLYRSVACCVHAYIYSCTWHNFCAYTSKATTTTTSANIYTNILYVCVYKRWAHIYVFVGCHRHRRRCVVPLRRRHSNVHKSIALCQPTRTRHTHTHT